MAEQHHEAAASPLVGVSYVMPVLNDASHVRAAVESILEQDYQGPVEVLIALVTALTLLSIAFYVGEWARHMNADDGH